MSNQAERLKRKARLLSQIQQQRLDLTACRRDWLETTASYDRGWNTFLSLRSWALVGSSVMAVWGVRHPQSPDARCEAWSGRMERLAAGEIHPGAATALTLSGMAYAARLPPFCLLISFRYLLP